MSIDDLIDQNRALASALEVERGHREAAERHADVLEARMRGGYQGPERRSGQQLADWTGLDRRKS